MKINFRRHPAFWSSISLHGLLLFVAILLTFVRLPQVPDTTHVFEMLASPGPAVVTPEPAPDVSAPVAAMPPQLKPLPKFSQPTQTVAKPVTPTPAKVKQVPARDMSYEEFKRRHAVQKPQPSKRPPKVPAVSLPKLNAAQISKNLEQTLQSKPLPANAANTGRAAAAIDAYGAQVNRLLNRAWLKPAQLAGVRLSLTVIFEVTAAGQIIKPRLNPSSGNAAFDRSVLDAFKRVGFAGISPNGQKNVFQMTFRMLD